jgi:sigma-B regulation protein RsbU (phosphoserine phosphatase)
MLGAFREWTSTEAETELDSGDTLLLYSDGVTEAGVDFGEEFGEERLVGVLRENQGRSAGLLVQAVVDAVADFSGGSRSDDVTVVGIRGI